MKTDSALAGYSGTPLPKKLNIKVGERVLLVGAPESFPGTLGPLPEGARLVRRFSARVRLVAWPKMTSRIESDLRQSLVRTAGLDAGLVDYKIAAIDDPWSGLKFSVRLNVGG